MDKKEKIKILYVDDEVNNLNGFKASFRIDYNVMIASDTVQAEEYLKKNPDIRVIFCDQRMPNKTGVQFFEDIRDDYPEPVRILLTGYTDIESVIDAINRGHVFRYIKKPWTDADIQSAIQEANKFYNASLMLSTQNQELERAYFELDKFAYSVSHDMRGPLMSILGALHLSRNTKDINELNELLTLMERSVKKLDDLILSVHEYYSLKRGELNITEINFNDIINDIADIYSVAEKTEKIRFTKNISQQEAFRCDEMYLRIILNNLLSNAFKYQKKDAADRFVELNILVTGYKAVITVTDNGIGIPEAHKSDIFKMFFRANSTEMGSGFGLYNVKDAVTKLGGEISVESKEGDGAKFTVILNAK